MAESKSIKETVYNRIIEDILSYAFRPGDILNEKPLVERYGYSKSSVREALLTLCEEGVLRSIPRCGYELVRITTDDIRDMLQLRCVMEIGLISLNCQNFSPEMIDRLEEIDARCTVADQDIWEHWKHNTEFHTMMLSYCNNPSAEKVLQNLMDRLKCAYAHLYWNHRFSALSLDTRHHKEIIRCLREKNRKALRQCILKDLCEFGGKNFLEDMQFETIFCD